MDSRINIITLGVDDLKRSFDFYKNGLGFKTGTKFCCPDDGIIFFKMNYVAFALYPYNKLAEDIGEGFNVKRSKFSGITLAHNTHSEEEVDSVLKQAKEAGAVIIKPAQKTEWGGYSGYFSDLDGHLWEVAYGAPLDLDGSVVIS